MSNFDWHAEEEEEEEEEDHYASARAMGSFQPRAEEELDEPGEEDLLRAAGSLVHGAFASGGGLRRRHVGVKRGMEAEARGGLLDDDEGFALGSERLDAGRPGPDSQGATQMWRQLFLAILVLAGVWAAAADRRPTEESFAQLRDTRYGQLRNDTEERSARQRNFWGVPVLLDRSLQARVVRSRYVDHGPFALAAVCLKAGGAPAATPKAKASPAKLYEHRYLGAFRLWLPLPYLPQPGNKADSYGVGLCVLGHCVCVPAMSSRGEVKGSKAGAQADAQAAKPEKPPKAAGTECWRFQGGKSAALNVMAIPNAALFVLWQFPKYWGPLSSHATLSMANLGRGRLWVLLAAPFSHRSWGEVFHTAVLLTNALDSFDRAEVSFIVFLGLYLGGCWAAWLARGVLWRRVLQNDASAFWVQEWGASGGLAAQLVFLARVRPAERFQFSLYLVPVPVTLSAWQSCFAHGIVDVAMARGGVQRQLLAHIAAWAVGWVMAGAWQRHV